MAHSSPVTLVRQLTTFGLVGVAATATHAAAGYLSVSLFDMGSTAAYVAGFFVAWWISFFGHQSLTFGGQARWGTALVRFIPHSAAMLLIGTVIAALLAAPAVGLPAAMVPVASAGTMPLISFVSSKFLVFRVL